MPVDKSHDRVQRMFGQIAGRYDLLNRLMSGGIDVRWRKKTVRTVPPRSEDGWDQYPILDVCCGTGDLALAYHNAAQGKVPVIGTDFTREMLDIAEQKQPEGGQIEYLQADTLNLPFDSDRFQLISVAFGLRNLEHTLNGLKEMTRVVRPGGHVVVLECSQPSNPVIKRVYPLHFRYFVPALGRLINRNAEDAYRYLPESVGEFPSGQALADLMGEAGLEDVRFEPLTFGVATLYWGVVAD